ncbi:monothiol glutaredoxin, Grx4 family [bacterium TMED277]|nr:MAG: monothiol glutaredoxin, Grx4 family [bacterium TMED277]|tara:strand:- start:104 stop:445 length:342 start_codon:yes stop_codon:yes gene_type:complete
MQETYNKIDQMISSNDVVLFMKGSPDFPQCGFSAQVVEILNYLGIKFSSFNVLEDDELRDGIKKFSNWPTIPQIYVKKEFIGGCDILREMLENNEIEDFLKNNKVPFEINSNN